MVAVKLSRLEYVCMKELIEDIVGIVISEEKAFLIENRLTKILIEYNLKSYEDLYLLMLGNYDPQLTDKIINAITTHESLWFRDKTPWYVLEDVMMPIFTEKIKNGEKDKIRIWSCACAAGQEPYSTAMCIDNYLSKNPDCGARKYNFEILASDISSEILKVAREGTYSDININRGLPEHYKNTYFEFKSNMWEIERKIKDYVIFDKINLKKMFINLGSFDIILCRNVSIYFSTTLKKDLIKKTYELLNPEGILFLGSSELFNDDEIKFQRLQHKGCIYYKK